MDNRTLKRHWTEESPESFAYRIAADFVRFIEKEIERSGIKQSELAEILRVSEGRVSQVLNNPGNMTVKKIVEYSRAFGKKVAIVGYDDGDAENKNGPIPPEMFSECWERLGKPSDHFELQPRGADNTHMFFVFTHNHECLPIEIDPRASAATQAENFFSKTAIEKMLKRQEWLNRLR
jgi:predicted XRE-type DNA-binding protein